ncbi:hypothetical protein HMPREF9163_01054 [Selenomonas sp. oral taxon 138 str. F0429]|nr:hypothetical protein HMPREF9163_01054 [Selenomonas sp. oral taxon 138 str. F0429]
MTRAAAHRPHENVQRTIEFRKPSSFLFFGGRIAAHPASGTEKNRRPAQPVRSGRSGRPPREIAHPGLKIR